jgi:2',3'-cyclic-nucleotide 2'-phosphodiesterase/3'-nucleotidase
MFRRDCAKKRRRALIVAACLLFLASLPALTPARTIPAEGAPAVVAALTAQGSASSQGRVPSETEARQAPTILTIIHLTDFHGALLPEDKDAATQRPVGGAGVVASYIKAEKSRALAESGGEVLLVASGDMMQGSAISNLSRGEAVIAVMNELGFEACAVGNHEFDWGTNVLAERVKQAKFPFLAANIFLDESTKQPGWLLPSTVVNKGKLKIGIIGAITEDTPVVANPAVLVGLRFDKPATIVNQVAANLRKDGADLVLVLSHLGGSQEREGSVSGPVADFASQLKGVDAVLDGHSHTVVSGIVGSIPVIISGSNGRRIGVMKLEVTCGGKSGRSIKGKPGAGAGSGSDSGSSCKSELIGEYVEPTFGDSVKADPKIVAIVDSYGKKFAAEIERVVAVAAADIPTGRQESALGNLISDVMREAVHADAAFTNSGGIRAPVNAGPITVGEIFRILPFDNTIVTMYLTGDQVRKVLEEGTSSRGVVQVSGLRFSCRQADPAGQRVKSITLSDGTPLSPTGRYLVATNDFMANGGDRFSTFKEGDTIVNTQILVRDSVISWMDKIHQAGGQVNPPNLGRVELLQ